MTRSIRSRLLKVLATALRVPPEPAADPITERFERRCGALLAQPTIDGATGNSEDGFVVQGPLRPDTALVLSILRRLYPREIIVLSTWADSPTELIAALRPYCSAVELLNPPEHPGGSNRNLQIHSTQAGLRKADALGARTLLKMRTDTCLLSPRLFDLYRLILAKMDRHPSAESGLERRIFVPQTYTKKFFPYHVSDIIMLGHAEDLIRYWDVPLDERRLSPESFSWSCQPLEKIGTQGLLPECYLGKQFADRLRSSPVPKDALADYWKLLRDHFVVMDDTWFDFYWLKRPSYLQPLAVDEVVSHQFWLGLYHGLDLRNDAWRAELRTARREGAMFEYDLTR